jgi:hypothetical protein
MTIKAQTARRLKVVNNEDTSLSFGDMIRILASHNVIIWPYMSEKVKMQVIKKAWADLAAYLENEKNAK